MNKASTLSKTRSYVKELMPGEGSGHEWSHIERVVKNALHIQKKEGGDAFIIELAALLHDIADWKFTDDVAAGGKKAREYLEKIGVDEKVIAQITYIIDHLSFKGGTNKVKLSSLEGQIVQDADRLDGIGAIGVARTFSFGGMKGRPMYDPNIKPRTYESLDEYKKANNHTINHFYEKLLLAKDQMNTKTARKLAEKRHQFMETFLKEFFEEWNSEFE